MKDRFILRLWNKTNKVMIQSACWNRCMDEDAGCITDSDVLMQYTGLNDKNGKPIYEGDIVLWGNGMRAKYQIIYLLGSFGLLRMEGRQYDDSDFIPLLACKCIWIGNRDFYTFENLCPQSCEVIGNIYENPELLEAK